MTSRAGYIGKETIISICINTVLSLGFVFLVFHGQTHIPVLGSRGIVLDMGPQTFMVTLMGCLVPGLLTRNRLRAGNLPWLDSSISKGVGQVVAIALLTAVTMTIAVVGLCWIILPRLLPDGLGFVPLLVAKAIFGALLAAAVTPWAIHRITRQGQTK